LRPSTMSPKFRRKEILFGEVWVYWLKVSIACVKLVIVGAIESEKGVERAKKIRHKSQRRKRRRENERQACQAKERRGGRERADYLF
jgi:hypothetical protein